MANLSDYITDTQSLMRDQYNLLTPLPQLIRWINQARSRTCLKTGCIEILIAGNCPSGTSAVPNSLVPSAAQPGQNSVQKFQTIADCELYSYAYANQFLRANNTGVKGIVEVKQVAISWGSFRPAMRWWPWQDLQAYSRAYNIGVYNYPLIWSDTGDGEVGNVWLWPAPSITGVSSLQASQGEMEWLVSCVPLPLYTANDYEAIPEPYTNAVKYKAASYCMLAAQRYTTAQLFSDMWADDLGLDRESVDRGKVNDYYFSNF
jgi:hypothetical protein